jgi:hypothetical protein
MGICKINALETVIFNFFNKKFLLRECLKSVQGTLVSDPINFLSEQLYALFENNKNVKIICFFLNAPFLSNTISSPFHNNGSLLRV